MAGTTKATPTDLSSRLADLINRVGLAWWVEISTKTPKCIYYFGPFANANEAQLATSGYVEDLEAEQAQGIITEVKRCKPQQLTIYEE